MLTLAPSVTLWDSGEFLAAIHTFGIPHPPGTPLYVVLGKVWSMAFAPIFGFARAMNLFSAACTAAACGILAHLFSRWTDDGLAATTAGIAAGLMSTVWLSATETEIYGVALLFGTLILWAGERAGMKSDVRWILLVGYLAGLSWTLHLMPLLALPSAILLAFTTHDGYFAAPVGKRRVDGRREGISVGRLLLAAAGVALVGMTFVLVMFVRAGHDPPVNQGNPATLSALADVVLRRQYDVASLWPRQAPFHIQVANVFEYADWQFALGLDQDAPPSWWRTPVTVVYALFGLLGFFAHRTVDRRSWRALTVLLLVSWLGVVIYLNLKAGPSFGMGWLPEGALHEARERDYFFFFAFVCWGLWAGYGAITLSKVLPGPLKFVALVAPFAPVILNWNATDRRTDVAAARARIESVEMLEGVPPNGVMIALGDNDTYPLWYLQLVEKRRGDVTVVTRPLLAAEWYRAELARRYKILDEPTVRNWAGSDKTIEVLTKLAYGQGRPVVRSPFFARDSVPRKQP
ncbi:MAG: DUF2723 domain-containing protein [Gemmatimonadaceae bacterium]